VLHQGTQLLVGGHMRETFEGRIGFRPGRPG
jgi:hypothetical protein